MAGAGPRRVVVFCGANPGTSPDFVDAARRVGEGIAIRGWSLVYGGHHAGLMGACADGCLTQGGHVTGVLPDVLQGREEPPPGIELFRTNGMHERKGLMVSLADAILALPGGLGTLDELFEQLVWRAIGVHEKPVGMLDVNGYWQPVLEFLTHAQAHGFVRAEARAIPIVDSDVDRLLDRLLGARTA